MRTRDMHPWVAYDDEAGQYAYAAFTYDTTLAVGRADSYEEARYLALMPIIGVAIEGTSSIPHALKEDARAYAAMKLWQDVQKDALLMHQQDSYLIYRGVRYGRNSVSVSIHGRRVHRTEEQPVIMAGAVLDSQDELARLGGDYVYNLANIEDTGAESHIRECEEQEFRSYLRTLTKAERAVAHGLIRGDEKKNIAEALAAYEPQYTESSRKQRISMHIRSLKAKWLSFIGMTEEEFLASDLSPV